VVALVDRSRSGDALHRLAGALERLDLGPDLADLATQRDRIAASIRSYLIPRSLDPGAPTVVVFAGPSGAGKSTLVNSLTGIDLSAAGVIRPTTRDPVVLASADNAGAYTTIGGVHCHVVAGKAPVLGSMVLVDTPDIDSTAPEHRWMAEILIDNADVVVFVTSALRYADAVPWQVLRRAAERGAPVIQVLNRVGSATSGAVVDFRSRLAGAGFDDGVLTVPEHHLRRGAQRIPSIAVRSLGRRLAAVTSDREALADVTYERVLRSIVAQATDLSRQLAHVADDRDALEAELAVFMADRVAGLYIAGVADGIYEPFPGGESRRAWRRWRRVNRVDLGTVERGERLVVERITALVHGDIRRWLADEGEIGLVRPGAVLGEVVPEARSAAEAWVLYVRRMAEEIAPGDQWLAEAVLIDAATDDEDNEAANHMWKEHSQMLVERARRELVGRLEVVYLQSAELALQHAQPGRGDLDDSDLRAAVGEVAAALAPIHA
jgi:energy-coupling factor transporter ATP-binding protein EcfA2